MKSKQIIFFLFFFFVFQITSHTQILVKGSISDEKGEFVSDCLVAIKKKDANSYMNSDYSKLNGSYQLDVKNQGHYEIMVSRLGYKKIKQELIIFSDKEVVLDFQLSFISLDEVLVVSRKEPILYLEDTIIYNISSFSNLEDENLEEVLKRMPNLNIDENGNISVKGKSLNGIKINGKEVSSKSNRMITDNIDPTLVDKIEVITIRDDLLNEEQIILNIVLKENVNIGLFGKSEMNLAVNSSLLPGIKFSLFSLKKLNIHIFGTYNGIGQNAISLDLLKKIDIEAYNNKFVMPSKIDADEDLEENPIFKNRNVKDKIAMFGMALKTKIQKKMWLTFTSYSNYKETFNWRNNSFTSNIGENQFQFYTKEDRNRKNIYSISAAELDYFVSEKTTINLKLKFKGNQLARSNDISSISTLSSDQVFYKKLGLGYDWNTSVSLNKKINSKINFCSSFEISHSRSELLNNIESRGRYLDSFELNASGSSIFQFRNDKSVNYWSDFYVDYTSSKKIVTKVGVENRKRASISVLSHYLDREKEFSLNNEYFKDEKINLKTNYLTPYFEFGKSGIKWSYNFKMGSTYLKEFKMFLPSISSELQYVFKLINFFKFQYDRNTNEESIEDKFNSINLLSYNRIRRKPISKFFFPKNESFAFISGTTVEKYKLWILGAIIFGKNKNGDKIDVFKNSPFFVSKREQLKSSFLLASYSVKKMFDNNPAIIEFQIDAFRGNYEYNGPLNTTKVLVGIKYFSNSDRFVNLKLDVLYNTISYKTKSYHKEEQFFISKIELVNYFNKKKIITQLFSGYKLQLLKDKNQIELGAKISYRFNSNLKGFILTENILGYQNTSDLKIEENIINYEEQSIFPRFYQIGLKYIFK